MGVTVERNSGVTANSNRYAANARKEISVERLLQWAYAVERVRGAPSWSTEDADEFDGGGCAVARGSGCHPDALIVDRVVNMLSPMARTQVRDHALAGTRPDWRPNARHRYEAKTWVVVNEGWRIAEGATTHPDACSCGGVAHLCQTPQGQGGRGEGRPYCPVIVVDHPDEVRTLRETFYVPWVSQLEVIRDALRAPQWDDLVLTAYSVTEALPPRFPWIDKLPVGRVLISSLTRR